MVWSMLDSDVRVALKARLLEEHLGEPESTLVVDELGLCGEARVDVALINGALSGYELKSARDRLDRLPNQVETYSRVLDFAHLVVAERHLEHSKGMLPSWWGIMVAREVDGILTLSSKRRARPNPRIHAPSLAQLLWREEGLSILSRNGIDRGLRSKPRHLIWERLASELPMDSLRQEVRDALKARRGWRGSPAPRGNAATSRLSSTTPRFLARRFR